MATITWSSSKIIRRIEGFVHTLSVSGAPADFQTAAYTAERIHAKEKLKTEFAAVTDVPSSPATSVTISRQRRFER
jgi:hypothetical protein